MQKLTENQALEVLKSILDKATKEGIFSSLNDVYTAVLAFDTLAKKITNEKPVDELG